MLHTNDYKLKLRQYVYHTLGRDEEFEIQEHLMNCDECTRYVDKLRYTGQENRRLHQNWVKKQAANRPTLNDEKVVPVKLAWRIAAVMLPLLMLIGGGTGYYLGWKSPSESPDSANSKESELTVKYDSIKTQVVALHQISDALKDTNQKLKAENIRLNNDLLKSKTDPDLFKSLFLKIMEKHKDYIVNLDARKRNIIYGFQYAGGEKSNANMPSDTLGIIDKVFWENETIIVRNRLKEEVTIKIYSNDENSNPKYQKEFDTDQEITNLNTGIYYYSIDNSTMHLVGGFFWVLPKNK